MKTEYVVQFEADDELNKAVNSNESVIESVIEDNINSEEQVVE